MLFDTHAHLNSDRFGQDRDAVIAALPEQGVDLVMEVGTSTEDNPQVLALVERYDFIYGAVGWHPHEAKDAPDDMEQSLRQWASHPKVRAIGEIGLDYLYDFSPRDKQREIFERQLYVAQQLKLPIILHERKAHQDTLTVLSGLVGGISGVCHCYSGSIETGRILLDMGLYIGFTGMVTFKNAHRLQSVAAWAPLEWLVIETDCPYMAPEPYRGQRNIPSYVRQVGEKIAELKGISAEEVFAVTMENGRRLFGI